MNNKVDYGFRVYHDVLKLEHIHFGYWEPNEKLTMENLNAAQERYTDNLIRYIPDGVKSILDVGGGAGSTASKLFKKGYEVNALSPDPYQREIFKKKFNGNIPFYLSKFEDFESNTQYDLVLMSESVQYQNLEQSFKKVKELLKPNAYLLATDYFRKERVRYYRTCHVETTYLDMAKKNGFSILKSEDITEKVLPTLDMALELYEKHAIPFADLANSFLQAQFPRISGIVSFLFKAKLQKLQNYIYKHTPEKLDSKKFLSMIKYMIYLFKVEG